MFAAGNMNVSRRYPSNRFFRWKPIMACFSNPARNCGEPSRRARSPCRSGPASRRNFAGCDVEPPDEPPGADLALVGPAPDEIHDLIPRLVRNPDPDRSSPSVFLARRGSAISSARTSSLVWIFFSK
jgi:hypothetical protein